MKNKYENIGDNELIRQVRNGNGEAEEYLLTKYSPMVKKEIRFLYIVGAETEDLAQEGMIGLYKAIRDYKEDSKAAFHTFATICVRNQIKSAVTASNRKKHIPLNGYISLYSGDDEDNEMSLEQVLTDEYKTNPESLVLEKEKKAEMYRQIEEKLSSFEKEVLEFYLEGMSYADISEKVGKTEKSINNALTRIRKKLSGK